jgi:phosphoribosyl-ATP pyrophosphohydrolase
MSDILNKLYETLIARKAAGAADSYAASLYAKGTGKIADKVREEAEEMIAEALNLDLNVGDEKIRSVLKNESADLIFHVLVMLAHHGVTPDEILEILEKRMGVSGHAEKAARK